MDVLRYIKQNYESLTDSEKLIANYLLKTTESIITMSAKEIASITKTSAPTVVRFAKKMGFNSLNEMKLKLSISLDKVDQATQFQYLEGDLGTKNIIYTIKNSIDSIMEQTVSLLKEEELDKAIELLINASNIYVYCVGVSALVGQDFYYKLSRINKRCISHIDTHLQITSSILMQPGDVALAISYSGETKEVIICAQNAKKMGIPVIAITKASINNNIADLSDVVLNVPAVEKSLREGAISSRISQLAVIDMLYIGITRNNIKEIEEKLIETRKAVKEIYH